MKAELAQAFDDAEPGRAKWERYVTRQPLERLTNADLGSLTKSARAAYSSKRNDAHLQQFTFVTPPTSRIKDELHEYFKDNGFDAINKRPFFVEGPGQGGKSRLLKALGKDIQEEQMAVRGCWVDEAKLIERIPVVYVLFRGMPTPLQITRRIAQFYGIPDYHRAGFDLLVDALKIWVERHGTQLIIVDELNFTQSRGRAGKQMNDHLKSLNNELPVTLIFGGINLKQNGFLWGGATKQSDRAQMERRSLPFVLEDFDMTQLADRKGWIELLNTIESSWYLTIPMPLRLSAQYSLYLYGRSLGHMGTLMVILNGACRRAMDDGSEQMSKKHLDAVRLSGETEAKRLYGLDAATTPQVTMQWVKTGRLTLTPDVVKTKALQVSGPR